MTTIRTEKRFCDICNGPIEGYEPTRIYFANQTSSDAWEFGVESDVCLSCDGAFKELVRLLRKEREKGCETN